MTNLLVSPVTGKIEAAGRSRNVIPCSPLASVVLIGQDKDGDFMGAPT
jgi:hypothetical protein